MSDGSGKMEDVITKGLKKNQNPAALFVAGGVARYAFAAIDVGGTKSK
jgi:hypothetical protein